MIIPYKRNNIILPIHCPSHVNIVDPTLSNYVLHHITIAYDPNHSFWRNVHLSIHLRIGHNQKNMINHCQIKVHTKRHFQIIMKRKKSGILNGEVRDTYLLHNSKKMLNRESGCSLWTRTYRLWSKNFKKGDPDWVHVWKKHPTRRKTINELPVLV